MVLPEDITVYIPSRKRPDQAARVVRMMLPQATVVVDAAEEAAYRGAGLERLLLHPGLLGLSRIRNFIVAQCPTRVTIQIDDDLRFVGVMPGIHTRRMRHPDELASLFYSTAVVAEEAGVGLFGWGAVHRPMHFNPSHPFHLANPAAGSLGTIDALPRWDERLVTICDIDATLRELQERRIVWMDMRFSFNFGEMFTQPGGLQGIRTSALREKELALLHEKWGDFLDLESGSKSGVTKNKILVTRS